MSTESLSASARLPRAERGISHAFAGSIGPALVSAAVFSTVLLITGCADTAPSVEPSTAGAPSPTAAATGPGVAGTAPAEVKTRNALFRPSRFTDLPGWTDDDLMTAWDAFRTSCKALEQREAWKPVCANASKVARGTAEVRRFFETEFALFQLFNVDASAEGDMTGYYEPLIAGRLRAEGAYTVPVYGVPHDLYTLDWKSLPSAQRGGTVYVAARGHDLVVAAAGQPGSHALDTTQFELDSRDRLWRIRLDNGRALHYHTRGEIEALGRLDAPVIAWVDDALALYAMQVQGSGRIRLRDGTELRVQYAEQNGHPFKPVRLASRTPERVVTRGASPPAEEPERFALAQGADGDSPTRGLAPQMAILMRGAKPAFPDPAATPKPEATRGDDLVAQLLRDAQRRTPPAPPGGPAATRAKPTPDAGARIPGARRIALLDSDPSYVFFRVAPDQRASSGPVGALGVPLTPGRSIAVDPRVTPMGYPVYLSAPTPPGSTIPLRRLVMAQDTGGAIRGAVRADFFWGFGNAAGQQAMRTRERGQMWLMLPHTEAVRLQGSGLVTRGTRPGLGTQGNDAECLIAEERFCSEVN